MNKTKVELTDTGIFVQILNPLTGRMEWKSQPEDYDYQQELARAAFAGQFKEGCNWGHGLSAAIKVGTPEKIVGTWLLHSGVYYEQSFSCRKNCTTQPFAFVGDSPVFLQKKTSIFLWCQINF